MTSLAETYLSCKTAMASKLNNKGITAASADDGLTTLINYIDDIAPGVNGLLLSADKSIGQSSNTVNFTALYVSDGNVVSGKSVNFYGLKSATSTSKSLTVNTWTPVGCKFGVSADSSASAILYLTKDSSPVTIVAAAGILIVNIPNKSPYSNASNIVFEDGILSFTYSGSTVTEDLSNYDCTNINASGSGFTIADYGVFDTTDANGVATAQYTCSGAGKFDVQAISGSVVSEPYTVEDCIFYDGGVTGNTNGGFYYSLFSSNEVSHSTDATGTTVTNNTSNTQAVRVKYANSTELQFDENVKIEFDYLANTNDMYLQLWKSNTSGDYYSVDLDNLLGSLSDCHISIEYTGSNVIIRRDGVIILIDPFSFNSSGKMSIRFMLSANASFKYKDFKINQSTSAINCTFYDDGITGSLPSKWIFGNATITRNATGTLFANNTSSWVNVYLDKEASSSSAYDWTGNGVIEFTVLDISTSASLYLNIRDSNSNGLNYNISNIGLSANDIVTIENNGTNIVLKVNGTQKTSVTAPSGAYSIMFTCASNSKVKYKEFKYYPI